MSNEADITNLEKSLTGFKAIRKLAQMVVNLDRQLREVNLLIGQMVSVEPLNMPDGVFIAAIAGYKPKKLRVEVLRDVEGGKVWASPLPHEVNLLRTKEPNSYRLAFLAKRLEYDADSKTVYAYNEGMDVRLVCNEEVELALVGAAEIPDKFLGGKVTDEA